MGHFSESLLDFATKHQSSQYGIAIEDFSRITPSEGLGEIIAAGLSSFDSLDRRISLFFCQGFLHAGSFSSLGVKVVQLLPSVVQQLLGDEDSLVRTSAYELLPYLKNKIPDYRERMLIGLCDVDAQVRTTVLSAVDSFLGKNEITPLFGFVKDDYIAETSPGGPLHYVLRNQAFLQIERRIGRPIPRGELVTMEGGVPVFWWDWAPLVELCPASEITLWKRIMNKLR